MSFSQSLSWRNFTFLKMTIFVAALWLANLSFIIWGMSSSAITPFSAEYFSKMCSLAHSPLFVLLDFSFVVFGLWIVRRYRNTYYVACVAFYGMLLGNVLGMVDGWVSCHLLFSR